MKPDTLEQILKGEEKPTTMTLKTLSEITNRFSRERIIGEGGFGIVYRGVIGERFVAVKRIRNHATVKLFDREFRSLMEVNHPNVVRFIGLCSESVKMTIKNSETGRGQLVEKRERIFCFEYITNGSLDEKITDELRGLEWDKRYQIIKGICAGLQYLHEKKHILHMDLKPANILLDDDMVPKITDFGLSRSVEESQTTSKIHFTSPGYGAPENESGKGRRTPMSDIYSLGVIIIEVLTGQKGIPDNNNNIWRRWRHRLNKSKNDMNRLEYHHQITKCIEMGLLCQKTDPVARPSISEILTAFDKTDRIESTVDKLNPLYWKDDMLSVEPLDLHFAISGYNENKRPIFSCLVELRNDTDGSIAFKIQTTSLFPYSSNPEMDILKSNFSSKVVITLSFANEHDYMAAMEFIMHKEYNEEFHIRSIKVNEDLTIKDLNEDMFDTHTTGHNVDEVRLVVISFKKEAIEFPSKTDKRQYTSSHNSSIQSGTTHVNIIDEKMIAAPPISDDSLAHTSVNYEEPIVITSNSDNPSVQSDTMHAHVNDEDPIIAHPSSGAKTEPRSLQLAIKMKDKAPMSEYNKKLILELTAGDSTSNGRPGLDLVAVLDIGIYTRNEKMGQLKSAMNFVVGKLSPNDRLSIVTFSFKAEVLWPLQNITPESQENLQKLVGYLKADGLASNIEDGLLTGLKVLTERKDGSGRVVSIMLMSDGEQSTGDATRVTVGNVPVYTFGLGTGSEARVLSAIAAKSMGGTYSHVQEQDTGGLTLAFSQCLAGLLSVSVRDLELTVAAVGGGVQPPKVTAGSYPQTVNGGLVTVSFGDLYSREVRKIIVEIRLPAIDRECTAEFLKVTYSYKNSSSPKKRLQFVETLTVLRTQNVMNVSEGDEALHKEEARLQMAKMIEDLRSCLPYWVPDKEYRNAKKKLEDEAVQCDQLLKVELLQLFEFLEDQHTRSEKCLPFALSSESSHGRQRFAARGGDIEVMRLFATPRMDKYLKQAKAFLDDDSTVPLPSADDDDIADLFPEMEVTDDLLSETDVTHLFSEMDAGTGLRDDAGSGTHTHEEEHTTLVESGGGRVQLAVMLNKKASLLACDKKVLLELTGGGGHTSDRPGLDLVTVLDVSTNMRGEKMDQVKIALMFVIQKLTDMDRLSIVTFSRRATKVFHLQKITDRRRLQRLIDGILISGDASCYIEEGLRGGLEVLEDRKVSGGRVDAIMLMSDGRQSEGDATEVNPGDVPVYTFGLGEHSDHVLLSTVAARSLGGTFSHVQDITSGGLTMACAQCVAGLLSVVAPKLELTVEAIGDESTIRKVSAGSYRQAVQESGSVFITFGNLYSTEVRSVIVDLRLPAVHSERTTHVLKVTYSYSSSSPSWRPRFGAHPGTLTVWRSAAVKVWDKEEKPMELKGEETRLYAVEVIKEARKKGDYKLMPSVSGHLSRARNRLDQHGIMAPSNMLPLVEMGEISKRFRTQETYEKQGRPYLLALESSHHRQRYTARGILGTVRLLYETPLMQTYLEQAKKFLDDGSIVQDTDVDGSSGREEEEESRKRRQTYLEQQARNFIDHHKLRQPPPFAGVFDVPSGQQQGPRKGTAYILPDAKDFLDYRTLRQPSLAIAIEDEGVDVSSGRRRVRRPLHQDKFLLVGMASKFSDTYTKMLMHDAADHIIELERSLV